MGVECKQIGVRHKPVYEIDPGSSNLDSKFFLVEVLIRRNISTLIQSGLYYCLGLTLYYNIKQDRFATCSKTCGAISNFFWRLKKGTRSRHQTVVVVEVSLKYL